MALNHTHLPKESLQFESSDHNMVGLEGDAIDKMRDNAPSIVGGLRLGSVLMMAVGHPLSFIHGLFVLGSEAVLLLYGNKEHIEQQKEESKGDEPAGVMTKAFNPKKYPIESSAAMDTIGEMSHLILGIALLAGVDLSDWDVLLGHEAELTSEACVDLIDHGNHIDCVAADGTITIQPLTEAADGTPSRPSPPSFTDPDFDAKFEAFQQAQEAAKLAAEEAVSATSDIAAQAEESSNAKRALGAGLTIHGVLGTLAHAPLWLLGTEKEGKQTDDVDLSGDDIIPQSHPTSLEFSKSESNIVGAEDKGLIEWFKDNQIAISSVLQIALGATLLATTGFGPIYQAAGIPLMAAGALQAAFVRKRDFSADVDAEEQTENQVHSASLDGKIQDYAKVLGLK